MSYALVFSGQGTQGPDMLPWLQDNILVHHMETALGVAAWRAALQDPAWATANRPAQMLLTATALAAWQALSTALPPPAAVAGYSVGELSACCAAGVFDASTALQLAHHRAQAMDEAARSVPPGGLLAVGGLNRRQLQAACAAASGVHVAIDNGETAFIVGGPLTELDQVQAQLQGQGARLQRLRIAVASHTPAMRPAAVAFLAELQRHALAPPRVPLFSNATGDRLWGESDLREALAEQIGTTVRWAECMEGLYARQVRCVLEVGPGNTLARRWAERYPDVPARSCDEFRSLDAVVQWVRQAVASCS